MHLYPVSGAAQRVGKTDTAYSVREALFAEVMVGVDPESVMPRKSRNFARIIGRVCIRSLPGART
jgi:hypothetical protein